MRKRKESRLALRHLQWIMASLALIILLTGCRTFRKEKKGDLDSMAEKVSEVIADPELATSIVQELETLEQIFIEYQEEQVLARQRILVLMDDYDASKEDILMAFEAYNELRRDTLDSMQVVGQSIRAKTSAEEWEEMENELQKFISRIVTL